MAQKNSTITLVVVAIASLVVGVVIGSRLPGPEPQYGSAGNTGNGSPSGAHYNLNLIGVPKNKTADMTSGSGHRIFVKAEGNNRILLSEGTEFKVLDANGTDGNGASFQMPNPDPDGDGITTYTVYARALGKPGGTGRLNTCAMGAGEDGVLGTADDEEVCSLEVLTLERTKGKSTFENVSKQLLYVYADIDGDGDVDRVPLFDDALQGYLWEYDNNGLKLVQLRFYQTPTNVN
jgi:hypothetical protein